MNHSRDSCKVPGDQRGGHSLHSEWSMAFGSFLFTHKKKRILDRCGPETIHPSGKLPTMASACCLREELTTLFALPPPLPRNLFTDIALHPDNNHGVTHFSQESASENPSYAVWHSTQHFAGWHRPAYRNQQYSASRSRKEFSG